MGAPNKTYFLVSFLATTVLIWIMLTAVSSRWSREKHPVAAAGWTETGLWRHCNCFDNLKSAGCTKEKDYVRTMEAFSVLSAILTALAIAVLLHNIFWAAESTKGGFTVITVLIALSLASSIVTWTVFSGYFKKRDLCVSGEPSLDDQGFKLDWGYGIRLVEFGFLGLALGVSLMLTCGDAKASGESGARHVLFVILLFAGLCTVFTTAGHGWLKNNDSPLAPGSAVFEIGLFDTCICLEVQDIPCAKLKHALETAEAFSVIALFFQFFHVVSLLRGGALKALQLGLGAMALIAITLDWILYGAAFSQSYCGSKLKDSENLHWVFGLQICACIVSIVTLIALATASAGEAAKEAPKAVEPTSSSEPAAAH